MLSPENQQRMRQLAWKTRLLEASTAELREIVKRPATRVRGYKAFAKRELDRRENATRCEGCGRKVLATLYGKCGACLRLSGRPEGGYCGECGEWEPAERLIGGRCPDCHAAVILGNGSSATPAGYVRAGDDLPPAEVFTHAEIERLEFVKYLVSQGRMES